MNHVKRVYASGSQKRAVKSRKIEVAVDSTPSINSYFRISISSADNPETAAVVDNAETAKEEADASPIFPDVPTTSQENENITSRYEEGDSTSSYLSTSDRDLFKLERSFPTDRAHFPSTIASAYLKSMILSHGPCRPTGLFEEDKTGRPIFSNKHYYYFSTGNLKVTREWLCFSPHLKRPYCHACWLFADRTNPNLQQQWIDGVRGSSRHYGLKIKRHESSSVHIASLAVSQRWKAGQRLDEEQERVIRNEANFWRQVLARLVNIIQTLSGLCLAFRGHSEDIRDGECVGGNFLGLVAMQAKFDPVFQNLLNFPVRAKKYLSAPIQNEIIHLLSNSLRSSLVTSIRHSPFCSVIVDTTSDISRTDQVSVIIRWIDVGDESASVKETFLGFVAITDASAAGMTKTVSEFFCSLGLELQKIRGQGFYGASVMNGTKGGMQKLFRDVLHNSGTTSPVPYVHCASQNLNLVINDAAEAAVGGVTSFGTVSEVFNFFSRSLNRWAELALTEGNVRKLKLKELCTTRWTSRIDAITALKNRYIDILKVLTRICLESKDSKERTDATGLKHSMEKFEFIVFIIIWERLLFTINSAPLYFNQSKSTY